MHGNFYNSSFRRYIVLMGDLFSRIEVERRRGDKTHWQRVPVTYASKEHFVTKLESKFSVNTENGDVPKIDTILPRMNLHMVDVTYNAQKKTGLLNRQIVQNQHKPGELVSQYNPVPIKMIFELGIYTRHQNDMFQIVEQIIPYFQPHFTTTIKEFNGHDLVIDRDINITWQSLAVDENLEGDKQSVRRLEWSMMFEVDGWIYPPVAEIRGEIRTIYLDFFSGEREFTDKAEFESVDFQVDPSDIGIEDWDKLGRPYVESETTNTLIPVDPIPPGVR